MSNDLEVISHLVSSMKDAVEKLEKSASSHDVEKTNKLKKNIFEISRKIDEELR